jgi:hypothetical protein
VISAANQGLVGKKQHRKRDALACFSKKAFVNTTLKTYRTVLIMRLVSLVMVVMEYRERTRFGRE